jgi:predicted dehydrogenase
MPQPATFGVVGTGWRAEFFVRLARLLPGQLTLLGGATRHAATAEAVSARWSVPVYTSPTELVNRRRPDFVISAVPWDASAAVITALVDAGARVLSETPPAPDRDSLRALWENVGRRQLVQVAEQYLLMPAHAARQQLVRRGLIGKPTSVQVSSTHTYHAISMMRGLLGVGLGPVTVNASQFSAPLVDPLDRNGWTGRNEPKMATTTLATLDFGGATGLYDFTDNQWHNQLRARRIVIRGSHGEIVDNDVLRFEQSARTTDQPTILRSEIVRRQLGYDLDLDGYDTEHLAFDGDIVYRNPFLGSRLMDEEIAIASMLTATAAWARDEGPEPYPLAEACQDHLIGLAIDESAASGEPVHTGRETWSY